ncbi:autotransporter outer membrane beta-barrel domain-containing protein [Variovorax atrisoli]|uniref:autotransporter outer membrane beta-barrel domain-containing protein n=1 Tax=Variovorax atrisoli TaxID=3394203 RepID=UPI003390E450
MNRTFRSVYNEALGAWVVASEVSAARGKRSSGAALGTALLAAATFVGASPAWAVNECGTVAAGGTVICNGDGSPATDTAPYAGGILYSAADVKVVVDGASGTLTVQPTTPLIAVANRGGAGVGTREVQVNGDVRITTMAGTAGGPTIGVQAYQVQGGNALVVQNGGSITAVGQNAFGISARTDGTGTATAIQNGGSISTTGTGGGGVAMLVETYGSGAAIATQNGGTVTTDGSHAVYALARGNGSATATQTGGSIIALSPSFTNAGIVAQTLGSGDARATQSGGTIVTNGSGGAISAVASGSGNATAEQSGGSVTANGGNASGIGASSSGAGTATAVQAAGLTASATGAGSSGIVAFARGTGRYAVSVAGSAIGGSGSTAAAVHTSGVGGGTIDIATSAQLDGSRSGIAVLDETGAVTVTSAGALTGDILTNAGSDSINLVAGSVNGKIDAGADDDRFVWAGGALSGGFFGQNGSDTAVVSAASYNGSQILDGGDDVSAADGWVDRLTLQGVTATAGGDTLRNWETITLDNTRLTLAGSPLTVGKGVDGSNNPMGLFIQSTSTVSMGQSAFTVNGDVYNAGLINLRSASGVPGNVLSIFGNYAGTGGIVQLNTTLGNDASATDKLVVNGNTSGTTRVFVNNAGGAGAATVNGIQVVKVTGTSSEGNFTLAAPVQAGAYEYGLHRGGRTDGDANSFYLSSVYNPAPVPPVIPGVTPVPVPAPEVVRPAVPGYVMGQLATTELGLGLLGSLHKRVGEQQTLKWDYCGCDAKAPEDQAWMRLHAQRLDVDGKRQFGFEQEMQYFQIGKDLSINYSGDAGDKSRNHTGISVGYGRTNVNFNDRRRGDAGMGYDTGKMKGEMLTLGAYHTRYADNGSYLDFVGQLHSVRNKYTDKYGGEGKQKGTGLGLSVEAGRPWQIGESQWLIEPQAQLTYQVTRYRGFADNISPVDGFTSQSLRGRVGARLAWNDKAERSDQLTRTNTFYFTANLLHEFKDPKAVTIGGTAVGEWGKQTWAELGVGGQMPLSKTTYLYGGVQYQRSLSGTHREGVSGQLGVRVAW